MVPYRLHPWSGHYPGGLGNELDNPQYMIDRLEGLNIDCVMVHGGNWKSDGTIAYDFGTSFEMWTNFINAMKDWNPDVKVLVWVLGYGNADLSDVRIRNTMYDSARELLSSVPFDGWNEDYEGWDGDVADAMAFYQGMASTVKGMGKIATIATEVEWGGYHIEDYAYLTNFDYIMPMFYAKVSFSNAEYYWDKILDCSPVPVVMGLAVLLKQSGDIPLDQQLEWIDTQSDSNLAGFALWAYDYMSYEDLEAWENWETKNTIGESLEPSQPEPESMLESPQAIFGYSPRDPKVSDKIYFSALGCSDADGTIVSYSWDFGDGHISDGMRTTHIYNQEGSYTVTLTVTDDDGLKDTAVASIANVVIVPEFPSCLLILVALFFVAVAGAIYKKKLK
jgi:hypothetical protein